MHHRIWPGLVLAVLGLTIVALVTVSARQAADRRDAQRDADVRALATELVRGHRPDAPYPAKLPDRPTPPDRHETYRYRADDGTFVVCAPFERRNRQAVFATATGTFRADAAYCRDLIAPKVAATITDLGMTDLGARTFLATRPTYVDKPTVKQHCQEGKDVVAIYGCIDEQDRIWVLDIADPGLRQLSEVTAAHELIHAYQLKHPADPSRLQAAQRQVNDAELDDEVTNYDPAERNDELDARLATEYPGLPADLEARYRSLFDRSKVLAEYAPYRDLLRELRRLKETLDSEKAALDRDRGTTAVGPYNLRVEAYNAEVDRYNALADRYNLLTK